MQLWLQHNEDSEGDDTLAPIFGDDEADLAGLFTMPPPEINTDEDVDPVMPGLQKYRECILGNPAYDWLLGDIQRHCLLIPSRPDVMAEIRRTILQGLPSQLRFSRRELVPSYKMTYTVEWDLVSFLQDQEYSEENSKALPLVITLTGSREAAQALTCSQYLHQTWPSSAGVILELLQTLLDYENRIGALGELPDDMRIVTWIPSFQYSKNPKLVQTLLETEPIIKVLGEFPDGTKIVVWFQSSEHSKNRKVEVEVMGSAYTIAEIGEQLSWLGSALRSSSCPDHTAYCQPHVEGFKVIQDKRQGAERQYAAELSADISFTINDKAFPSKMNGECWHNLFRSAVVVEGYPISRRPEVGAVSGLEIPLQMMARLARANYVNTFLGGPVIKGFSAMLVPTENHQEVIIWHLVHNKNGDRISYLDSPVVPADGVTAGRFSQTRHILGWCSDAKYLAGTREAKYEEVSGSRLPRPREDGLLSQAFISSGQIITGGVSFLVGYKDRPFHVSRGGYLRKLKWIIQKSVVLWDEEAKRGWLLNGASALLHLVRASIVHDSTGPLSSACVFKWENLKEPPGDSRSTPGSAVAVLLNETNRALTIYPGKDDQVQFEDRVEHFLNILEQIFDYQVHSVGPDGSGYSSKCIPRAHFEGWDFHDLATESDPLHPRLATFASKGKTWVDFTRSIHAINLLGRGFGALLEPSGVTCPHWASLPKGQYYLAAGIADLKMVLEYTGDLTTNPIRLSENLAWHNSATVLESCGCDDAAADHADMVQVILPATLSSSPEKYSDAISLAPDGAVVFGYNRNCQWRWGDAGDPERHDIMANETYPLSPNDETGHGSSNALSVGSESDSLRLSSTQVTSMSTEDTIESTSADNESARPKPLVRSYTRWNLESLRPEDYTVGIVCALPLELLAVRALFDQTHPDLCLSAADSNHYALGSIGRHKVVAACLPDGEYGTNSAADVASNLRRSFHHVKFCLMVGIGGGVPSSRNDIRLGDVVVSKPIGASPGVIQYDMGKALENGVFEPCGFLQPPPRLVMTALSSLKSDPHLPDAPLQEYIREIAACRKEYRYPGPENDRLFSSVYTHNSHHATCDPCSVAHVTTRPSRSNQHPQIHYGLIASGNRVMKDAKLRDRWSVERNVLCFEMEAAGIMNTLPCLVIRGICDYSDSHKNKQFQEYAAATAASYAKLLLSYMKDSNDLEGIALRSTKDDQSLLGVLRRALAFIG
ncbi:uncharacterized protein N7482_008190 [Penicillium canariense]|uniref:Nucleoside phosphorylase domain-containing protein n=1 Tax=Penicillium canariense TaxID=189055 RepID=A0A9W9LIR6_9EURO|nr:uncharacterized protein N7482_008190 [Penicillium canariense]KAJ5157090.1 hypothetical protein N7482_008190 [Penicillium canariense]